MKVKIFETGKLIDLSVFDPTTGVDYSADLIGNTGALNDGQFELDPAGYHLATQETVTWWQTVITDIGKTDEDITSLAETTGLTEDVIRERITADFTGDLEDERRDALRTLAEIKAEYAIE
jgi:hypothetical protein